MLTNKNLWKLVLNKSLKASSVFFYLAPRKETNFSLFLLAENYVTTQYDANYMDMIAQGQTTDPTLLSLYELLTTYTPVEIIQLTFLFLFFFIFGFLIYGALFAIIGAASDVDTETQQFIFPLTIPLLTSIMFAQQVIESPNSTTAKLLTYIPYTSSITSVVRNSVLIGEPGYWLELLISMLLLFIGFLFTVWVAARIYRIGILSYGSKVGYKEIIRWFFEKR